MVVPTGFSSTSAVTADQSIGSKSCDPAWLADHPDHAFQPTMGGGQGINGPDSSASACGAQSAAISADRESVRLSSPRATEKWLGTRISPGGSEILRKAGRPREGRQLPVITFQFHCDHRGGLRPPCPLSRLRQSVRRDFLTARRLVGHPGCPLQHCTVISRSACSGINTIRTRLCLSNIIAVALGSLDQLDTRSIMFVSCVVLIRGYVVLLALFRRYLQRPLTPLPVLVVGLIWFTFADVQNALWAIEVSWFLPIFCFVATVYSLVVPNKHRELWFVVAAVASVAASVSIIQGFIVWPLGAICIVWCQPWGRRGALRDSRVGHHHGRDHSRLRAGLQLLGKWLQPGEGVHSQRHSLSPSFRG